MWKCIQYTTTHWDKTQMLKKFPSDIINGTKNVLFFLSRPPTPLLLIWVSYKSWSTKFISLKLCLGFSIFDSVSFLLKFIFLFNKLHGLFDFKTSQLLSKLKQWKNHTQFCSQTSDFQWKFNDTCVSWNSPKTDLVINFGFFLNPPTTSSPTTDQLT